MSNRPDLSKQKASTSKQLEQQILAQPAATNEDLSEEELEKVTGGFGGWGGPHRMHGGRMHGRGMQAGGTPAGGMADGGMPAGRMPAGGMADGGMPSGGDAGG